MIVITIAFVFCFSWLRSGIERYADRKLSPCCQFIVSGFVGLLTYPFMCRGFPLAQTHCFSLLSEPWQLLQWPIFTARKFPVHGNNALEIQLFSEFCLHPSNPKFTDCGARQILSMSGTLTRFPCSANKHACPIVRVAHLPQKPCYLVYICAPNFTHTKRPLLPCDLAGKRSLVFSVYSVWLYAKTTFLFK